MARTPVTCLHHMCNEMPLNMKHKFLCLKFKAHLFSFTANPAQSLIEDCCQERFPDSPGFCSYNMFTKLAVDPPQFRRRSLAHSESSSLVAAETRLSTSISYSASITTSAFVATAFSSHLHNLYGQFVKLYTDGSKTSTRAGCGINIADKNLKYSIAINKFSFSITSKLFAILHALYLVYLLKIVKVVIFTDSLSSL